ncbi:hypothetical protein CR513_54773, partial [Mucuna pruriens]
FKEGTSLSDHLNEFQGIIVQMSGMGIKFEDEILRLLLLNSLPESWETFKVSITNSASNVVVSLQMVKDSVLNEEMRRKAQGSSSQSEENKDKKGKSKEKDDDDDDDDRVTTATVNFVSDENMWIIDSGATLHVTQRKQFFTSYTISDFGVLKMGNDGVTKVIAFGNVCLLTNTGMQLWLRGIKYALDVRFNLIFVHMLDDGGYDNHFGHGKWKLTKGNLVVARGEKISKLYWTKALVAKDSVNAMDIEASLWHRRLSHISEKGLNLFSQKGHASKIKECIVREMFSLHGKQTRVSFKKHPPSRKSELLELAFVERQSVKKVKCIRFDNGGEYCGPFDIYCKQQGIRYEKTPPKTPQLNGLAERMNKTLIERVRCMLSEARLPKHFWGEALYTAVHAFVHVPKDERSKLDMKTRQCIFIGYGHDEYGYKMYDPIEKKLVRSRDVQFMEDQTIEDIDKVKKSTPEKDNSLFEIDPVLMPVHDLDTVDNNVQNGEQYNYVGNQQLGDGFDVPLDDDAEKEQEMSQDENLGDALEPPPVQLKRSNRYTSNQYVTLTDGEEPECYQESMESEERQKAWQSKLQKCVALSTTKAELGFVQEDEHWLFCDSQSADMMNKMLTPAPGSRSHAFNKSGFTWALLHSLSGYQ